MAKGSKRGTKKATGRSRQSAKAPKTRRSVARFLMAAFGRVVLVGLVVCVGTLAWTDLKVRAEFDGKRWAVPARIYSRAIELWEGRPITKASLALTLDAVGYRRTDNPARPGTYRINQSKFVIHTRSFSYWDGEEPEREIHLTISNGRIVRLREDGKALALARVDPALIARVFPSHQEDRVLVRLSDLPKSLVSALVSMEDRNFYQHFGLSFRGIARAMFENVKAGAAVQGGSTLTQQLAKNYFLSGRRTLGRKVHEAFIALILEARYEKDEILEAYLNEIFLGQEGARAIHGFGLASHFYFGRPIDELSLSESALLVALARGASYYNPRRNPERALARRNLVLDEMARQALITQTQADTEKQSPLGVLSEVPKARTKHPAFVDLVRRQLRRDYHEDDLKNEGLRIFTTLDPAAQYFAESTLSKQLNRLEEQRAIPAGDLQGAVVVTSTNTGEVLAVVGDREVGRAGFNRALDAKRPIGSVIKPLVYLTALERGDVFTLNSMLMDEPVSIESKPGELWTPQNYDKESHGPVPLIDSLVFSYNQATVNLGMSLGVEPVIEMIRRLGVEREVSPYPSVFLGAVSLSPIEVVGMYQTLASGGFEMPLRAISEVIDSDGQRLSRYGISVRPVIDPEPSYLINHAMTKVMELGTGRSARRVLGDARIAGKTGTTDDLRDSWFAGFDAEHLVVSWIGKDDNTPTGLTGASGALKVWAEVVAHLGVVSLDDTPPEGVSWQWSPPGAAFITDAGCENAIKMPYLTDTLPPHRQCHEVANFDLNSAQLPEQQTSAIGTTNRKE